jgi:hypothetical protein
MTDLSKKALELEYHIRDYVPKGYLSSIENVMFVPWVSIVDIKEILQRRIPDKFNKFPFDEAINSWITGEDMAELADGAFMEEPKNCNGENHNWQFETPSFRFCTVCGRKEMYNGKKWQMVLNEGGRSLGVEKIGHKIDT